MVAYGDHRSGADRWHNAEVEHGSGGVVEEFGLGGLPGGHSEDAAATDVDEPEQG